MKSYDAVVIGSGHNGLVSACYLAKAGKSVLVLEKSASLGGATTSALCPLHKGDTISITLPLNVLLVPSKNSSTIFLIDSNHEVLTSDLKSKRWNKWLTSRVANDNSFKVSGEHIELTFDPYFDLSVGKESHINRSIWRNNWRL